MQPLVHSTLPQDQTDADQREFWQARLASHLAGLFESTDPSALAELEVSAQWVSLRGGDTLFRRGDAGDAAYIVVSGRLRAVDDAAGERALDDIAVGETVGEMALLTGERRSATVYAVRDSLLAKLSAEAFHRLIQRFPRLLQRISSLLVQRLRRQDGVDVRRRALVRTIAVVPAGSTTEVREFSRRLAEALAVQGGTLHLDGARVQHALCGDGVASCPAYGAASPETVQWLNEQELAHRFVLYEADPSLSEWTQRVVRQSDHVVFVADAAADPQPSDAEQQLAARWADARAPRRSLVLLHGKADAASDGSAAFLEPRRVDCHYHVGMDKPQDFTRLARCLTGTGIGLVLGGGGARGFAHLGVLCALAEAGVPIDWVGGTSIGAIIAALAALGVSHGAARERCKEHFVSLWDPTLPLVALLSGRRIRANLERAFGTVAIEDLPLPCFCVSTNLSRATQTVHERGSLLRAIRASISLPGILPPVTIDRDLHIDGGLVNNLPIDVMHAKPEIGTVLAVDVSPDVEMRAPRGLDTEVSGWRVLREKVFSGATSGEYPTIMSLLARSSLVASTYWARERGTAELASLFLRVPAADFRLLDFDRIDELAELGYQSTRDAVQAWWDGYTGPAKSSSTHALVE